jgi:cAMP-binding proteins - catabolite gene activator and regulatory subunit of cAMP-dependent protein kinases
LETRHLVAIRFAAGDVLMHQGESGDRFVMIEAGTAEVEQDGRVIRALGPGGYCGEIALLRGGGRTATVRATSDCSAFVLDSASFLAAVTGDHGARGMAEQVVDARLANAGD